MDDASKQPDVNKNADATILESPGVAHPSAGPSDQTIAPDMVKSQSLNQAANTPTPAPSEDLTRPEQTRVNTGQQRLIRTIRRPLPASTPLPANTPLKTPGTGTGEIHLPEATRTAAAPVAAPKTSEQHTRPTSNQDAATQPDSSAKSSIAEKVRAGLEKQEKKAVRRDPLIGRTIANRFTVISKIGIGGMGAVYKAKQKGMDRDVAIKVLLKEFTENENVIKRFHLEALAVSKLRHPNTISIFDFGQTDDGILYIAMEYLEGQALDRMIRKSKQLAINRTLYIMSQACRSLDEAHDKGIVHRDLKPDNIFVVNLGGDSNFVKVLDFGVAKLKEGDKTQGTLTQAGMIFGTPKYMSPEQSRSSDLDARSDIYSLGIIMYEMLTGMVPFTADNPLAILIQHVQSPPPPFGQVRPDLIIPVEIESLVAKALAKNVNDRYESANEFHKEIEKIYDAYKVLPEFDEVLTHDNIESIDIPEERRKALTDQVPSILGLHVPSELNAFRDGTVTHISAGPTHSPTDHLTQGNLDTSMFVSQDGLTIAPMVPVRTGVSWPKVLFLVLTTIVVLAGGAALFIYSNLTGLPADYTSMMDLAPYQSALEPPAFDVIKLTLKSDPVAATVYLGDKKLGTTPLIQERLKGEQMALVFKASTFKNKSEVVTFSSNDTLTVTLEAEKKAVVTQPPPEKKVPEKTTAEKKGIKKTKTETKATTEKKETKPKDKEYEYKKVPELKTPYSGGGKKKKSISDNPYD